LSKPREPKPVKLVTSIFSPQGDLIGEALASLSERYGSPDYISGFLPFDYTDYYGPEMGSPLVRRLASFEALVKPEVLPDVKLFANGIENRLSYQEKRRVNIDPGYVTEYHLILATGKGYAHRPYLRDGIYADLTLIYRNGAFCPLEWTYPDYASEGVVRILTKIREKYILQLRALGIGR
jgi:hypothetical protein